MPNPGLSDADCREAVDTLAQFKGVKSHAAQHLGMDRNTFTNRLQRAAERGYAPANDMTHIVPEGYKVKGVSTYYDSDGQPRGQWVKSTADNEAREALLLAACEALCEGIPRALPLATPEPGNAALCNVYTLTDSHVGMLACAKASRPSRRLLTSSF